MEILILILCGAVLAAVLLFHRRMARRADDFGARLEQASGELAQRMAALAAVQAELKERATAGPPAALPPESRVEEELAAVRGELQAAHAGLRELSGQVAKLEGALQTLTAAQRPRPASRPEQVRGLVAARLQAMGYHSVVVQASDEELAAASLRLRVEAERNGLRLAGTAAVDGDQVGVVRLEPRFSAFP